VFEGKSRGKIALGTWAGGRARARVFHAGSACSPDFFRYVLRHVCTSGKNAGKAARDPPDLACQ
jgi:hypothetical protein